MGQETYPPPPTQPQYVPQSSYPQSSYVPQPSYTVVSNQPQYNNVDCDTPIFSGKMKPNMIVALIYLGSFGFIITFDVLFLVWYDILYMLVILVPCILIMLLGLVAQFTTHVTVYPGRVLVSSLGILRRNYYINTFLSIGYYSGCGRKSVCIERTYWRRRYVYLCTDDIEQLYHSISNQMPSHCHGHETTVVVV